MTAIRVQNLGKRYRAYSSPVDRLKEVLAPGRATKVREFVALEHVSFEIARGTALGVVGPNGAGKSTLLKILAGIVEPSEGTVEMNGRVSSILELGAGFHPDFTGRENVFLNAAIMGYTQDKAASIFGGIEKFCELGRYIDMPVRTYSSGMFVRLAFAVAISAEPDILLVDEALAVGDAVFAHRCLSRIRQMRDRGVTIVYVSHDTNTVAGVCDRAIFLDRGHLQADGPPKDVIHVYLLNVAQRLTAGADSNSQPAAFHEIGAVEATTESNEKRFGSFQARITDVFMETPDGQPATKWVSGETAIFRIVVRFDRQVDNPIFGIMFKNRFGVEIFGTNTYLRKMGTGTFRRGDTIEVRFETPMMLGEGVYTASFAVHGADGHYYDYRVDTRVFEVGGVVETIGMIALPVKIAITPVSADAASDDGILAKVMADAPAVLEPGRQGDRYLGGDWYAPQEAEGHAYRWMGSCAVVHVSAGEDASHLAVTARAVCPEPEARPVTVVCRVGQQEIGSMAVHGGGWDEYRMPLPPGAKGRVITVELEADHVWVPREYDAESTDTRELAIMVERIAAI